MPDDRPPREGLTPTRHAHPAVVAAFGLPGLTIAAVLVSMLVWLARGMTEMPVSFGSSPLGVLGLVISPICYAAVGGVLAARLPANPVGWLFIAMGAALGMMLPVNLAVAAAHDAFRPAGEMLTWVAWIRTTFGTPVVLTAAVVAVLVFPDGRLASAGWRPALWLTMGAGMLLLATAGLDPVGLVTYPSLANPMALPYELRDVVGWIRTAAAVALLAGAGVAVLSIWRRYRDGDRVCRAQLRWIVVSVAVSVAAAAPFVIARYALRVTDQTGELLSAAAQLGACAFPLAAAFAISRYRLFDIDVLIGRSLVYLPLMAVLGGLYTASVALFQRVFVALTGSESDLAVIVTILVVASAFTPARRALEAFVDRRFAGGTEPNVTATASASRPSPAAGASSMRATLVAVDDDGRVDCPVGADRTLRDCLRCPHLVTFVDDPELRVVCAPSSTS
jgi:hypothetical protein